MPIKIQQKKKEIYQRERGGEEEGEGAGRDAIGRGQGRGGEGMRQSQSRKKVFWGLPYFFFLTFCIEIIKKPLSFFLFF